jgi:hypothetical protein
MTIASISEALDCLASEQQFAPTWEDILERAGMGSALDTSQRKWRRSWLIAVVVLVAVLVPLAAIGSERGWWFLSEEGMGPKPVTDVVVVKAGSWEGHDWELVAYRSDRGDICWAIGNGMACTWIPGVPRGPNSMPDSPVRISALRGTLGPQTQDTAYIVGPVSDKAEQVEIYLSDGQVVRTPTFAAPKELGSSIRFYATQLPSSALEPNPGGADSLKKLAGLDRNGRIVACLTVPFPKNGMPLSACE